MAINKLTYPNSTQPTSLADWQNIWPLVDALFREICGPKKISGTNVLKNAIFQIGGSVYLADADTAISGTETYYVKITPSGATASAEFVVNLTGVSWNDAYNGYYDSSGNLYVFNEQLALDAGEITEIHGRYLLAGGGEVAGNITFSGNNTMTGNNTITISGGVTIDTQSIDEDASGYLVVI